MEWLLLLLAGGGGGWAAKRWRDRWASRRTEAAELDGVRRLANEDVTFLGEQLQRLDRPIPEQRVMCFSNPQHGPSVTDVR